MLRPKFPRTNFLTQPTLVKPTTMTSLRKVGESIEKTAIKSILCGTVLYGAGISYYLLKRNSAVELVGMEMREWVLDGVLLAVESITGDLIGSYAVPYLEQKFVGNDRLEAFIKYGAPPMIVGAQHILVKKYFTDAPAPTAQEIILSGVKLAVDGAVNTYMPNM
jgi:hypothetical protein